MIGNRRQSVTSARAALRLRSLVRAVIGPASGATGAASEGSAAPAMPLPGVGDPPGHTAGPPRPRVAVDMRAAVAMLLVATVAVVAGVVVWLRARPYEVEIGPVPVLATGTPVPAVAAEAPAAAPAAAGVASASPPAELLVDVQGEVRRPGVVRLPVGSRVRDALRAAGGARHGVTTSSLNLARPLTDGEQLVLDPERGPAVGVAPGSASGTAPGAGTAGTAAAVDLNTAGLAELDDLPGVGPVLAQRILEWRERNGRFSVVEELQEVAGIGPATFADLRVRVRV